MGILCQKWEWDKNAKKGGGVTTGSKRYQNQRLAGPKSPAQAVPIAEKDITIPCSNLKKTNKRCAWLR